MEAETVKNTFEAQNRTTKCQHKILHEGKIYFNEDKIKIFFHKQKLREFNLADLHCKKNASEMEVWVSSRDYGILEVAKQISV